MVRNDGKPRPPTPPITCGRCTATWTGLSTAHCGACHRTFSGFKLFDTHRHTRGEHGGCSDPATLVIQRGPNTGQPVMFLRDGVWSGPEMTEEQKTALYGDRAR